MTYILPGLFSNNLFPNAHSEVLYGPDQVPQLRLPDTTLLVCQSLVHHVQTQEALFLVYRVSFRSHVVNAVSYGAFVFSCTPCHLLISSLSTLLTN